MNRITELALRAAAMRWYQLYREKPVARDMFLTQAREAEAELIKNGKVGVSERWGWRRIVED